MRLSVYRQPDVVILHLQQILAAGLHELGAQSAGVQAETSHDRAPHVLEEEAGTSDSGMVYTHYHDSKIMKKVPVTYMERQWQVELFL